MTGLICLSEPVEPYDDWLDQQANDPYRDWYRPEDADSDDPETWEHPLIAQWDHEAAQAADDGIPF